MKIVRTYPDGNKRVFTVTHAQWANAEKTAAVMFTQESGAVLTSQHDQPEVWQQLMDSGLDFHAHKPLEPNDEDYANALMRRDALERVKAMTPEQKAQLLNG